MIPAQRQELIDLRNELNSVLNKLDSILNGGTLTAENTPYDAELTDKCKSSRNAEGK